MSAPEQASPDGASDARRAAWKHASVRPLWENPLAHNAHKLPPQAYCWTWASLKPLVLDAMTITNMAAIERRVLTLIDPAAQGDAAGTTTNLTAALQILMPGESARPHRHSMNALRFVIDGNGATTTVDGKPCAMMEGDLVITPGGAWHEHTHHGTAPIIWLDALDAPLHRYLGTDSFEPGPIHDVPDFVDDAAFVSPNIVPDIDGGSAFSPVFRYPWADASRAVAAAPKGRDGARRVRYVNPQTGGSAMPLLDCYAIQIDAGAETKPVRSTANAVCAVVEGHGTSRIGERTIEWGPKDIFSMPHGNWMAHNATDTAKLFVVTDRDALQRLGLLREEHGNAAP
jgi:gentisate 1,2-dioxygenase